MSTNYVRDGFSFTPRIWASNIAVTNGTGLIYAPSATITANPLYMTHTRAYNMLNSTTQYIGPSNVAVHERAMLGLKVIDGAASASAGVDDQVTGLEVRFTEYGGSISALDFMPFTTNPSISGLAVYLDDGPDEDVWDPFDSPVSLASIAPERFGVDGAGGATIRLEFSPPVDVPATSTGAFDLIFVVRSRDIQTGDAFRLNINLGSVTVRGVLPADGARPAMTGYNTSSNVMYGDDTGPTFGFLRWGASAGPYLGVVDDTMLFYNRGMSAFVCATAYAYVYDTYSGLDSLTFSSVADLGGPNPMTHDLTGNYQTVISYYEFSPGSPDSGVVTASAVDNVGNPSTSLDEDIELTFMHESSDIHFSEDSGWYSVSGQGIYLDPDGTVWFSDLISSTSRAYLEVNAHSLYGRGIMDLTASVEPQLEAPNPLSDSWGMGQYSAWFYTSYGFWANSSQGDGEVTVTARDYNNNMAGADFPYRKDSTAPTVSITAPATLDTLFGTVRLEATVSDAGSGIDYVWYEQRPDWYDRSMYSTLPGQYFADVVTSQFSDGPNRIIVFAIDNVGNIGSAAIDVVVSSSTIDLVPPEVGVLAPASNAYVSGTVTFEVEATDGAGLEGVWVRTDEGPWVPMSLNSATGNYEVEWDTSAVSDGEHTLTARARDVWRNEATTLAVPVTVDNTAPVASVSTPAPGQAVEGTVVFRVYASDLVGVSRVSLEVGGRTVDMAYNPASGYFEYELDTSTMPDGAASVQATAFDASGKTVSTQSVEFSVANGDTVQALYNASPFLLLLFLVAVAGLLFWVFSSGRAARWMSPEARAEKPAKEGRGPTEKGPPSSMGWSAASQPPLVQEEVRSVTPDDYDPAPKGPGGNP